MSEGAHESTHDISREPKISSFCISLHVSYHRFSNTFPEQNRKEKGKNTPKTKNQQRPFCCRFQILKTLVFPAVHTEHNMCAQLSQRLPRGVLVIKSLHTLNPINKLYFFTLAASTQIILFSEVFSQIFK
jgi:hypothetical protein